MPPASLLRGAGGQVNPYNYRKKDIIAHHANSTRLEVIIAFRHRRSFATEQTARQRRHHDNGVEGTLRTDNL